MRSVKDFQTVLPYRVPPCGFMRAGCVPTWTSSPSVPACEGNFLHWLCFQLTCIPTAPPSLKMNKNNLQLVRTQEETHLLGERHLPGRFLPSLHFEARESPEGRSWGPFGRHVACSVTTCHSGSQGSRQLNCCSGLLLECKQGSDTQPHLVGDRWGDARATKGVNRSKLG